MGLISARTRGSEGGTPGTGSAPPPRRLHDRPRRDCQRTRGRVEVGEAISARQSPNKKSPSRTRLTGQPGLGADSRKQTMARGIIRPQVRRKPKQGVGHASHLPHYRSFPRRLARNNRGIRGRGVNGGRARATKPSGRTRRLGGWQRISRTRKEGNRSQHLGSRRR